MQNIKKHSLSYNYLQSISGWERLLVKKLEGYGWYLSGVDIFDDSKSEYALEYKRLFEIDEETNKKEKEELTKKIHESIFPGKTLPKRVANEINFLLENGGSYVIDKTKNAFEITFPDQRVFVFFLDQNVRPIGVTNITINSVQISDTKLIEIQSKMKLNTLIIDAIKGL